MLNFQTSASRCRLLLAVSSLAVCSIVHADELRTGASAPRVGLILSHLPPAYDPGYRALQQAAGNPETSTLEMTRSEMWSIPAERIDALRVAAQKQGVDVMVVGTSAEMTPMSYAAMTEEQKSMMHMAMDSKAAMGITVMSLPDPKVMEYALTASAKGASGASAADSIVLPLNAKLTVTAHRRSVEKTADGYRWHGIIEDTGEPVTLLWWPSGRLSGHISYKNRRYIIRHLGGQMHGIVEMAPEMLPPDHAPMAPEMMKKMQLQDDPLVKNGDASMLRDGARPEDHGVHEPLHHLQDAVPAKRPSGSSDIALLTPPPLDVAARDVPMTTITLLVAYTKAAAQHYSDIEQDLIALAVEDANQSFRNSQIGNVRIELVKAYETDYVEQGTHFEHVFRFADRADGYMEEVHAIRDQVKADVALLIVHDANGCGLAAGVAPQADRAFAVVHHECAALSYSVAHEIGHIIGARHDLGLDDSMQPYAYGHGFVSGTDWRTMMSYEESCGGCARLPIWSNPRLKVGGVAAGDTTADNARVISEGAARVANFR